MRKLTPEQKRSACARAKKYQAKCLAAGLCSRCGGKREDTRIYCASCRAMIVAKQKIKDQQRKAAGVCIDCTKVASEDSIFCGECKEKKRIKSRDHYLAAKDACYRHYGGYECACCGETNPGFLTLDHVNNDGKVDRHFGRAPGGYGLYIRLRSMGFPSGFAVMCFNCNCGRAHNKYVCPHKQILASHLTHELKKAQA